MAYKELHKLLNFDDTQVTITEEPFTVPGAGVFPASYTVRLKHRPDPAVPMVFSAGFTQVDSMPTATGEVYVDYIQGDLVFYTGDSGDPGYVTYQTKGSLVQACDINQLILWSSIAPLFIPGIPAPYSGPMAPLGVIYIPTGIADFITIKGIELSCSDLSQMVADARTEIVVTTFDAVGDYFGSGTPNIDGNAVSLYGVDFGEVGVLTRNWWFAREDTNWTIDLREDPVYLNVFLGLNTTEGNNRHADINITLKGV